MIPFDESGVVLHLGGEHQLAAGLVAGRRGLALDDQGGELGPGGVDGRGQPGRARSDDDDLPGFGHARQPRLRAPGSVRWLQATMPIDDEDRPDHQVGQPHPAVEDVDGEQPDEGDRERGPP